MEEKKTGRWVHYNEKLTFIHPRFKAVFSVSDSNVNNGTSIRE